MGAGDLIVLTAESHGIIPEHPGDDRQRLIQGILALRSRQERDAKLGEFRRVPADPEPEYAPALTDPVQIGRHAGHH